MIISLLTMIYSTMIYYDNHDDKTFFWGSFGILSLAEANRLQIFDQTAKPSEEIRVDATQLHSCHVSPVQTEARWPSQDFFGPNEKNESLAGFHLDLRICNVVLCMNHMMGFSQNVVFLHSAKS